MRWAFAQFLEALLLATISLKSSRTMTPVISPLFFPFCRVDILCQWRVSNMHYKRRITSIYRWRGKNNQCVTYKIRKMWQRHFSIYLIHPNGLCHAYAQIHIICVDCGLSAHVEIIMADVSLEIMHVVAWLNPLLTEKRAPEKKCSSIAIKCESKKPNGNCMAVQKCRLTKTTKG